MHVAYVVVPLLLLGAGCARHTPATPGLGAPRRLDAASHATACDQASRDDARACHSACGTG